MLCAIFRRRGTQEAQWTFLPTTKISDSLRQ